MPTAYVQKVAVKQGRPVAAVDADWKRAEKLTTAQYGGATKAKNPSKFYGIVTHIFQKIAGSKATLEGVEAEHAVTEEAQVAGDRLLGALWESSFPDYEWTAWLRCEEEGMWDAATRAMWAGGLNKVAESGGTLLLEMPWLPTPANGTYDPEFEKHTTKEGFLDHLTGMFSGKEYHDKHHNPASGQHEEGHLHLKSRAEKEAFHTAMREDPMAFAMAKKKFGMSGPEVSAHIRGVIDKTSPPGVAEKRTPAPGQAILERVRVLTGLRSSR